MTKIISNSGNYIATEGESITIDFNRTSDTTATITWTIPPEPRRAYNGFLIVLSTDEINPSNSPTNGIKYIASADFATPADKIGSAQVVAALYNDEITNSVNIIGLDADDVYYASGFLTTTVRQYYSFGVKSYPELPSVDSYTGDIPSNDGPPTDAEAGHTYYDTEKGRVLTYDGLVWIPVSLDNAVLTGTALPTTGTMGSFFYNTVTKKLFSWTGVTWMHINTVNKGIDTPSKVGVGTDGSYVERKALIDILKKQLGWPAVCVELTEDHFNIAIDNSIQELRRRIDNAYKRVFIRLQTNVGQNVYYLNDPALGTNKIVDIVKVYRTSQWGLMTTSEGGLYAQAIMKDFFMPGGQIDLVSVHLIHQQSETFSQLFAADYDFGFDEYTRELTLYKRVDRQEYILIEASAEKTEQEMLIDRWMTQWIQGWALSECREILGMIRGKFASLPGAGGGISLNGSELIQQANEEKLELLRQINDYEVGNGTAFGNYSFLIG
jgi:hypothetical protein